MDNLSKLASVSERDIDLLLVEELNVSQTFSAWLYCEVTGEQSAPPGNGAWHSVSDAALGESDIVVLYGDGCAVLIENKIDAVVQPEQGHRYNLRGESGLEKGVWTSYFTCMIAPELYLNKERDSGTYATSVSYESIRTWFASRPEDVRAAYRAQMLSDAIEQNRRGYTAVPDERVSRFWADYWSHSVRKYPELEMKRPGTKPANSDWPEFRPSQLDNRFLILHKLLRGDVDLQIAGAADQVDKISDLLSGGDAEVVKAGKSAAVRLKVPTIDRFGSLEAQRDEVEKGLQAAQKLVRVAMRLRDRL